MCCRLRASVCLGYVAHVYGPKAPVGRWPMGRAPHPTSPTERRGKPVRSRCLGCGIGWERRLSTPRHPVAPVAPLRLRMAWNLCMLHRRLCQRPPPPILTLPLPMLDTSHARPPSPPPAPDTGTGRLFPFATLPLRGYPPDTCLFPHHPPPLRPRCHVQRRRIHPHRMDPIPRTRASQGVPAGITTGTCSSSSSCCIRGRAWGGPGGSGGGRRPAAGGVY